MKVITGNQSPKAEEKTYYEVTDALFGFNPSPFFKEEEKYTWTLFKKDKSEYKPVANNKKYGIKVPYTFGENVVGIPFKIVIHQETRSLFNQSESKLVASYVVTPKTSKEPVIGRVILLNRGKSNVNKAKFNETLTAQARTTNLLGKEITFYLWEEGASEGDKYKKPKKGRVNKDGIAEVQFNLMEYASQNTLMDFFSGSKAKKNFFVTAVYEKKQVSNQGAVQASDEIVPEVKPNKPVEQPVNKPVEKQTDIEAEGLEKPGILPTEETKTPASVDPTKLNTKNCGGKFCITTNSPESELIKEINIRLAGFGGNIPTSKFTDRSERMVKQFQRDYMKVPETGKVCGNVLRSIDDFCSKWVEQISTYKCLCHASDSKVKIANRCAGYGKGKKNEHPGEHRSLLWGVSALKYYLSQQKTYKYRKTSAGYRCWAHNDSMLRTSTNHMGKAVDIQFTEGAYVISGKVDKNLKPLRNIRDQFYIKYLKAEEGWIIKSIKNNYRLEPIGTGKDQSYSWIHMDVALFEPAYLKDEFFTKKQESIINKSIVVLANELGFKELCNCLAGVPAPVKPVETATTCFCFKQGKVKSACAGKGSLISKDLYEKESKRIGVETAMMLSIAKQESKRESFYKEGQATILFERHKMWEYLMKDLKKSKEELKKLKAADPAIVNDNSGGYGKYSEQYEKLEKAKKIDYNTAVKSCSWGKFQVMGFNYAVAFSSPKEMEKSVNLCEIQQFYFFIGYLEKTNGIIDAMKNKNWELIAAKYNGSKWKTYNPDYATNIKKFYNEFKK